MNHLSLPSGFMLRPATVEDAEAISALIGACDIAAGTEPMYTAEDVVHDWDRPNFNLEKDTRLVIAPDNSMAGYEAFFVREAHVRVLGDGYVHPQYRTLGLGSTLLTWLMQRVVEHQQNAPPGSEVVVRNGVNGRDLAAQALHEDFGYQPVRNSWHMQIDMEAVPLEPVWPKGIHLQSFRVGQDERVVFDATEDAFRDHWGYLPWDYDDWLTGHRIGTPGFDPSIWFIAMDGDEVAGTCLCRMREKSGWVSQLAVRRPWRKQGLGQALLYRAFGEFYRRGVKRVGLGVDAQNPTGATRLYERSGMQVADQIIIYEKKVPSGRPRVDVTEALASEEPLLANLMELYLHDFSAMEDDLELDDNGRFGYKYLPYYWQEPQRAPFIIRANGRPAGFVLVRESSYFDVQPDSGRANGLATHSIAEFFVVRKYRKQGIGAYAAVEVFKRFAGRWEVAQIPENPDATLFWRKVIDRYTGGQYEEFNPAPHWNGPVQVFCTPNGGQADD